MGNNKRKANSVEKTGLYWPGKRTEVDRIILPFQVVETVNESREDREKLALFRQKGESAPGWRNKLIWGDNKYIMASLLPEFAGKINLIYIDPPFATGADFSINVRVGDLEWTKEASVIEEKAYRDTWGKGLDSYLQMMYDRLVLMRELLADNGTIWVHLDEHVGHYVKVMIDEIFGYKNFINQIIWHYPDNFQGWLKQRYPNNYSFILAYSKTLGIKIKRLKIGLDQPIKRPTRKWDKEAGKLKVDRDANGEIIYIEYDEKYLDDVWTIPQRPVVVPKAGEYLGYNTQKPEELLRRVILSASNPGDIVADFFCGSGTTGAVAEKLGRRWIMADLSKFAIHTSRKRLLDIPGCKPFEVLNLGSYQKAKLRENGIVKYIDFILKLYRAESVSGYTTLHGRKAGRMVHIGAVDSIVTLKEVQEAARECASIGAKALDVLGWDFEMGLHDLADKLDLQEEVTTRLVQIPKEALEVKDAAREQIRFFDLNYLKIEHKLNGKLLEIILKDFAISNPEYLPDEVREKIRKFTDLIDYWAVDFDYKDDTFHNMWQSFRMKKHPKLETKCSYRYEQAGKYQVLVKVVDIFGNDTNKLLEVKVS